MFSLLQIKYQPSKERWFNLEKKIKVLFSKMCAHPVLIVVIKALQIRSGWTIFR